MTQTIPLSQGKVAKDAKDEMARLVEQRAGACATLAYQRALGLARSTSRLHKNKSLYFARCGDAVKIGVSNDPLCRLGVLQTGAPGPITLLAAIEKAGHRESECHKSLSHLHLYGEWFRYTPEVDSLIEELT